MQRRLQRRNLQLRSSTTRIQMENEQIPRYASVDKYVNTHPAHTCRSPGISQRVSILEDRSKSIFRARWNIRWIQPHTES